MRWVTRAGVHIDRAAGAWLLLRFVDPVLWRVAGIVHVPDLEDERYDAPEAAGCDLILRALSVAHDDDTVLGLTGPLFDAVHDYLCRSLLAGTDPL